MAVQEIHLNNKNVTVLLTIAACIVVSLDLSREINSINKDNWINREKGCWSFWFFNFHFHCHITYKLQVTVFMYLIFSRTLKLTWKVSSKTETTNYSILWFYKSFAAVCKSDPRQVNRNGSLKCTGGSITSFAHHVYWHKETVKMGSADRHSSHYEPLYHHHVREIITRCN